MVIFFVVVGEEVQASGVSLCLRYIIGTVAVTPGSLLSRQKDRSTIGMMVDAELLLNKYLAEMSLDSTA
jgi:hypothetical protein